MGKLKTLQIEIEDLLRAGMDIDTISKVTGAPLEWVISTEMEMMGLNQYGYEESRNVASYSY